MSKLIRVSEEAYEKLSEIAQKGGFSRQQVIDQAINKLEREAILKQANDAYAAMRRDPKMLQEHEEELALWESTMNDGLEDE